MRRFTTILAAAAVVAALAPAAASAGSDKLHVFFPGDCQTNEYKPRSIQPFCADAGMPIERIRWTQYGARVAHGRGVAIVNDCDPNCAAGDRSRHRVRIKLARVRQCGDVPQFTRLRVKFVGKRPKAFRKAIRQRVRCADAPSG